MRLAVNVLLAGLLAASAAIADECDARAADLVRETGAMLAHRSGYKVFFKLRDFTEFNVICKPLGIEIGIRRGAPPDAFFEFASQAVDLVARLPAATMKYGAIKCQRAALRSGADLTVLYSGKAHLECKASKRPPPGETWIAIMRER
jgi:hypothetical protein